MSAQENQFDNLVAAIDDLETRGFLSSFRLEEKGLKSLGSGKSFAAGDIKIKEFHRFEGATDFEDMAILYGIETTSGERGIIIDAFGTYASRSMGEFLKKTHFSKDIV